MTNFPEIKLAGQAVSPVVVIDSREQAPLKFARLPSVTGTLTTGDYSFQGAEELFAVERKSIDDLVACCMGSNRERFGRELHRLRGYHFKRLLIVGSREDIEAGAYRSRITSVAVLNTLAAFEARYDLAVVFEPSATAAAALVERWVWWFAREVAANAAPLLGNAASSARTCTSDSSA